MKKLLYALLVIICWSCTNNSDTEKYQNKRNNIIQAKDKVKEIKISEDDVLIGSVAQPSIIDDYLIISNPKTIDKLIYIFHKNNFSYLTGITYKGQGPSEIANMGHLATDEANRMFYVSDHGKQVILTYHLDSILNNQEYMPKIKMKMNKAIFPNDYLYVNDTLCIGSIIEPIGDSDFKQSIAKWNMNTGEIKPMKYTNPKIEKKRINFTVSIENDIYVECYSNYDLMTICNMNGDLKYNIYGPAWTTRERKLKHYYDGVVFCNNKILASFSGGDHYNDEYYPTKFLVYDIDGNYKKTIDIGYKIIRFCFDKENNRIIMNLNSEMQFAYLELNGFID